MYYCGYSNRIEAFKILEYMRVKISLSLNDSFRFYTKRFQVFAKGKQKIVFNTVALLILLLPLNIRKNIYEL